MSNLKQLTDEELKNITGGDMMTLTECILFREGMPRNKDVFDLLEAYKVEDFDTIRSILVKLHDNPDYLACFENN